jgi:hypothetical protein
MYLMHRHNKIKLKRKVYSQGREGWILRIYPYREEIALEHLKYIFDSLSFLEEQLFGITIIKLIKYA